MPDPTAVPSPASARLRLDYLDGLRGLAALFVVVHHAYAEVYDRLPLGVVRATQWLVYAQAAVDVFIVLSGYCLMLPVARAADGLLRGGAWPFYGRRARRILPPYYAALALSLLMIALVPGMGHPTGARWDAALPAFTPAVLLSHLFLVHCFVPGTALKIDYPMWTVALEWNIYLLFPPLLLPLWRRFGVRALLLGAAALVLLLEALQHRLLHGFSVTTPWFLFLFALGMAGAAVGFSDRPRLVLWRRRFPWGLAAALLWLAFWVTAQARETLLDNHKWEADLVVGLATVSLIVYCIRHLTDGVGGPRPAVLRLLEARAAVGLGAFSYSLYLVHAPLLALLHLLLAPLRLAPVTLLLVLEVGGVSASLLFAYAFHRVFERPFMAGHARTPRQFAEAAVVSPAP